MRKVDNGIVKFMIVERYGLGVIFTLLMTAMAFAQGAGKCGELETDFKFGHPAGSPVIFGKEYEVPNLTLRFVHEATRKPVSEKEVIVRYVWRWFEYPYPENLFGVWSDAYDLRRCLTGADGSVIVPEHRIVPTGWYKSKLLLGRKPSFQHLDISITGDKTIRHQRVSRKELDRLRKTSRPEVVLTAP